MSDPTERRLRFRYFTEITFTETAGYDSFGNYHPRIDGVDADLSWTELLRQRSRNRVDGAFRGVVNHGSRRGQGAGQRTDVDDAPAVGVETLECFLSNKKHPEHICIKHFVKLLLGDVFEWHPFVHARVVDQNVDLAKGLLSLSKKSLNF